MADYLYWEGNMIVRKNSLAEIRKHFIQHHSRTAAINIFGKGSYPVGRIYWAGGSWNYKNYDNGKVYELNESGVVRRDR